MQPAWIVDKGMPWEGASSKTVLFLTQVWSVEEGMSQRQRVPRPEPTHTMAVNWRGPIFQPALAMSIIIEGREPRVTPKVAERPINFLLDTGAAYSRLTSFRHLPSVRNIRQGIDRNPRENTLLHFQLLMESDCFCVPVPGYERMSHSIVREKYVKQS